MEDKQIVTCYESRLQWASLSRTVVWTVDNLSTVPCYHGPVYDTRTIFSSLVPTSLLCLSVTSPCNMYQLKSWWKFLHNQNTGSEIWNTEGDRNLALNIIGSAWVLTAQDGLSVTALEGNFVVSCLKAFTLHTQRLRSEVEGNHLPPPTKCCPVPQGSLLPFPTRSGWTQMFQ
jgi:hypothetical protein